MILGTAGHIDHGKTALVRALTGVDTDRLPEERRRGITIDLGFAPLPIEGIGTLGVIDVPGHEGFVRTMLAGATGIDLALLVIAADEGVMPQTREHLAILGLLGVRGGVVALTKRDLVDADWLALVTDDVRATLDGTPFDVAPVVATSVRTGEGLETLRATIAEAARGIPARAGNDLFRLPIDRAFTVRGTGTVVTGTVWSGTLARDAEVRILPCDVTARARGLQIHGRSVASVAAGDRAAIALAGVGVGDVARGAVIVSDGAWRATRRIRATVSLLSGSPSLGARTRVRFHLGTHDVGARVVAAGGTVAADSTRAARIVFDAPVVARAGDRFVLRGPTGTLGGGVVEDPLPDGRRMKPWSIVASSAESRLARVVADSHEHGVSVADLALRIGAGPEQVRALLHSSPGAAVQLGDRLFPSTVVADAERRLEEALERWHGAHPLDAGAPLGTIRAAVRARGSVIDEAQRRLVAAGRVRLEGALVARAGWHPTLSAEDARVLVLLVAELRAGGSDPPSLKELVQRHGASTPAMLRMLEREGRAVRVDADRWFDPAALAALIRALRSSTDPGREYGPSELREILGIPRRILIPFLEYCDLEGVTERRNGGRLVRGT